MSAPIIVRVTTSAIQATVLGQQTTDTSIRAAVSRALLQREEANDATFAVRPVDVVAGQIDHARGREITDAWTASWGDLEDDLEILSQVGGAP